MPTIPLLPLPNGRMRFSGESLPLPAELPFARCAAALEVLDVFARRAGVTLTEKGQPLLRLYRNEAFPAEGYRLRVTKERGIQVEAATEQGLCWALATLYALIENNTVPCCDITDQPRYAHRGILLDCARHFFSVETVKEFIESISLAKINVLHWHLTDDQGWRIESKLFPALHEQCAPDYYTQEQIREVVAFARARGVEIVPEIDLPGLSTSILSVFPELGCAGKKVRLGDAPGIYSVLLCPGKEAVFELLLPLLEEIAGLFPSGRFHLGGDEAPKVEWNDCPDCQQRMKDEGLNSAEELQGWFTARLAAHLRKFGKQPVCWNESLLAPQLPGLAEDLIIQYWAEMHHRGPTQRFWEKGGQVIFSDMLNTYLDQPHGLVPMKRVYAYEAGVPWYRPETELPALGLEACVWTEHIPTPRRLGQMTFPRAYALSEAAWTQPGRKDYQDFLQRLEVWLARHPGLGFTPPKKADIKGFPARMKDRAAFLKIQAKAPRPENNAWLGGKLDPGYSLRWVSYYFR